jgi:two-component system OmpR family response regulator
VLTREFLAEHLYDEDVEVESNVIDVYVASLRRKLGQEFIRTQRGRGYVVDDMETHIWES